MAARGPECGVGEPQQPNQHMAWQEHDDARQPAVGFDDEIFVGRLDVVFLGDAADLTREHPLMLARDLIEICVVHYPIDPGLGAGDLLDHGRAEDDIELLVTERQGDVLVAELHGIVPVSLPRQIEVLLQDIGDDDTLVVRENGMEVIPGPAAEIEDDVVRSELDVLGEQCCTPGPGPRGIARFDRSHP